MYVGGVVASLAPEKGAGNDNEHPDYGRIETTEATGTVGTDATEAMTDNKEEKHAGKQAIAKVIRIDNTIAG